MKTGKKNAEKKNWGWTLRRCVAMLLVLMECVSLATVGVPASYAEGGSDLSDADKQIVGVFPDGERFAPEGDLTEESPAALEFASAVEAAEAAEDAAAEAEAAAQEAEEAMAAAEEAEELEDVAAAAEQSRTAAEQANLAAERAQLAADYAAQEADRTAWAAEDAAEEVRQAEEALERAYRESALAAEATEAPADAERENKAEDGEKPGRKTADATYGQTRKEAEDNRLQTAIEEATAEVERAKDAEEYAFAAASEASEASDRAVIAADAATAAAERADAAADSATEIEAAKTAEAEQNTDGDDTDGDNTDGDDTDGDNTDGDETKGDETKGDETKGDKTDGDETKGDETKGDETKGDETKGDETKGDETKGDETKGDETDGDETKDDETKDDETKDDEKTTDDSSTEKKEEAPSETLIYSDSAVSLSGEAPAELVVETEDVSAHYADFDPNAFLTGSLLKTTLFMNRRAPSRRSVETKYSVLAAYDISLSVEGEKYQPDADNHLTVSISDPAINKDLTLQVWHIHDDGTGEQIYDFTVEGDSVTFAADSFSAYLVVQVTVTTYITAGDGNTYLVSVTYDQDAEMPENADLAVRELDDDEKKDYVNQSAETLKKDAEDFLFARAFDISLIDPETGDELQPVGDVKVSISLLDMDVSKADKLNLLHFGKEVETVDYTLNESAVEFDTDGFSVFVLCGYTVDFHWGEYTYSIVGESEIALSALLEKLGVTEITVADVADVAFSDPALVEVEVIKDEAEQTTDWLLKSLAPFNTDEVLTLILKNGLNVEIKVTDAATVTSGTWSNGTNGNGEWSLDNDGVLTLSGTGRMNDYSSAATTPWGQYRKTTEPFIRKLVVSGGITYIAKNLLARSTYLNEIDASQCTALSGTQGADLFKATAGGGEALITSAIHTVNFSGNTGLTGFGQNALKDVNNIQYLDISGTQFSNDTLSNKTEGFGASIAKIQSLKANNCSLLSGTLDLSGYSSLQILELSGCTSLTSLTVPSGVTTLDVSGCTGLTSLDASGCAGLTTLDVSGCTSLTSLTVPSGITTLDISGCTGLDSLNLSSCTALTTVKVGNRDDHTDLSWLTLPESVTTLDASGFTSLTSVAVPASVTSLDVSGCTGITALDLSGTSLTSIDVSKNASLTALKLPATVSELNITSCPNLVIYFDGSAESLPDNLIPEGTPVVCWGDYTYTISRHASVKLSEIFKGCGFTEDDSAAAAAAAAVSSITASDSAILEVSKLAEEHDWSVAVHNLEAFADAQTLTLTFHNGMTGRIGVVLSSLEESSDLNSFLNDSTIFKYNASEDGHRLSESAILNQGDSLYLTLSFSEIPEGEEGERQMALLAPMTYTFPEGLTVLAVNEATPPTTVPISIQAGGETYPYTADVALGTNGVGEQVLTVTGNFADEDIVRAATAVSFTVPVTVQVSTVPANYALGGELTLSAVNPRNVKVSISSGDNVSTEGAITYTVTVEAESDLDDGDHEYPVEINDLTVGTSRALQFLSGSYTYTHKDGFVRPEGADPSTVNGEEPTDGAAFDGFPVTVKHMYEGDKLTLTYTAKPLHGSYVGGNQAEVKNTVTITNSGNPSNNPEDDMDSVTNIVPYAPLTREYVSLDGSWAYWRVTVNPGGYTLGESETLILADTFHDGVAGDAAQSIDYASVEIVSAGHVTYDYSGNTGTFVIPNSTPATITYRTRITAQPGESCLFRGTAQLKDGNNVIASSTAGVTVEAVVVYPSASDVGGFGDTYMVRLFVYAEGQMQKGIEGATFILLDANQRPLVYKVGENKDQPVSFTTGSDGYVDIVLDEEPGDISIEKNTGYYLEMMQALKGYQKDNTLYSFMITDDPSYNTGGFYKYYNGDTMKVRLYPADGGLSVSIRFSGSYALREDQQDAVVAVLQKMKGEGNWDEVERHPYTDTKWGAITFTEPLELSEGEETSWYRVVVENEKPWDLPKDIHVETTYYCLVNPEELEPGEKLPEFTPLSEPQEFYVKNAGDSVSVVIDNRYEEPQLTLVKMDKKTGKVLPGAVFSVYKISNGAIDGDVVVSYTTDENGELVIRGGDSFESETLYGIKEAQAPTDYLLPLKEDWRYFYFCNDEYLEPSILANLPQGATAVNLTNGGDRITVDNQKEIVTIPVMKLWQGSSWPDGAEVLIGLYQSVEGGEAEPVYYENENSTEQRTVTLTGDIPYNNTAFAGLPSRDDQGRNITYSIKEEKINGQDPLDARYNQEYGVSSAGVYIVRNKPATTLTVSKEWYRFNADSGEDEKVTDESVLAAQSSVTFDVYRSSTKFEDETPDDGITNADMMSFVKNLTRVREKLSFGADNEWSNTIRDLDRQDDLGNPYYYYILETVPSFGNELYVLDEENRKITIQNRIAPKTVNLTVTKAALKDDPRTESLNTGFEFTLTLKTMDGTHPIRSWQVYTDEQNPEYNLVADRRTDWEGKATFTLKPTNPDDQPTPGASITLSLPVGVKATVTESYHHEYTVETSTEVIGTTGDNGRTFTYNTSSEPATLTYTNTLHVICKVVTDRGAQVPFESLKSALKYIHDNPDDFTSPWTIYMLEDYTIPVTDVVEVLEGESLTLTTASVTDTLFPFKGGEEENRAVITRGGAGDSMLKNAGTLTLANIVLDGNKDNFSATMNGGLVYSTGTLNLNVGTTLRNSRTSGKGGAVYAEGTVNIPEDLLNAEGTIEKKSVTVTGNSAPSASALYLKGTLNMTGGSISDNIGASDGAVVVESMSDVIKLSGGPVIFNNTNAQGKAANLFIGADSDTIVEIVEPGLSADARIGITAMEGHMAIGEQFATKFASTQSEQTDQSEQTNNLGRFVNDIYGYKGKLKDGTSTNVVWDGLTIKINKVVGSAGANPNDRFTITLSSLSIIMSTYVIDGTLDYTVTAARQNRPGTIVLRNVKAGDEITISPLPVGSYKISEAASNYAPTYTIVETGSAETPAAIDNGTFNAEDSSTITVTNTRRTAKVKLTKGLDDRLVGDASVDFNFTVKLSEADGTAVSGFTLVEGITTGTDGVASFTMSPYDVADDIKNLVAPVGATMTITETVNDNYRIDASAKTMPEEGEGAEIADLAESSNVFSFQVTDDGANVSFENIRKLAEIELSKTLVGKVSKEESFTFTLTLKNQDNTAVANYLVYKDEQNPENNITITTDENGVATIPFSFGENETETKSITLKIPEGIKLTVAETEVKKNVGGTQQSIYDTTYSVNGGTATPGTTASRESVSEADKSIAFTNTRKTNTITVTNTVKGYSGNVVPFTYTATVTDGGENQDDYDLNGFKNGVMTFELTTGQSQTLTVPYGATLTVTEGFVVGYETTVKRGNKDLGTTRTAEFQAATDLTVAFTNSQLIGLRLVNNTSSTLQNVQVYVGYGTKMYRVNDAGDDQDLVPQTSGRWATLESIEAGKTAQLEIMHKTGVTDEQDYTVKGTMPTHGYYYTIHNEPSFHEFADPAILRVYDESNYEVKGKLRYSVEDSTVTFSEQPLVSFDANGGAWTTQMDDYHDRDGDRRVYQYAVNSDEKTVASPTPDPIYPTAEGIPFLGWTANEDFAKEGHTAGEDISAKAYDFDKPVTAPVTLYAVWAKPARDERVVTVKNGHNEALTVTATLSQNDTPTSDYALADDLNTDADGKASIPLPAGESKNLTVPDRAKLDLSVTDDSLAVSSEYALTNSDNKSFTIAKVERDGTVTFIPGVCKITDEAGAVLYDTNGNPAVYGTLSAAFTAYGGTLYTDASHTTAAEQAAVKMLVDEYTIQQSGALTFPNKTMTLTTAGSNDSSFPYVGIRDRATIYRAPGGLDNSCFTLSSAANTPGTVTLTNIILDGGSERGIKVNDGKNGALINVTGDGATLNITEGATLRNVEYTAYTSNANGGAVYMTKGTLNVNAGLFSNLHAYQGGAICVTGGTLNVTGTAGSTQFEDCRSERQDGGAIYHSAAKDVVINGGTDEANPGIIFTRCVAAYTNGTGDGSDGGAIFATSNYNNTVTVKGCSFVECSARTGNSASTSGYGGGGICAYKVKGLTVEACTFESCDTLCGGGAVAAMVKYTETVENETVTINNCSFNKCNCKGQAGAVGVYQDNNGAANSATKLSIIGSTFENCSSGTNNGSGGAVQCYLPCMVFTDSHFIDCWAGKEGGAVNNFFGGNYTAVWAKSSMTVTNCRFIRCRAEDRYQAEQMQHYGGGINSKAKTVTVTGSYFEDCVSTLREGGALHLGGQGGDSKATITGSTFKNCTAKTCGGAVLASTETLEVSESFFYGCQTSGVPAANYKYDNNNKKNQNGGGAISHSENSRGTSTQKTTLITNCIFAADPNGGANAQSCGTATDGGAIWTRATTNVTLENLTIEKATAGNYGGGIYLDTGVAKATITDGSIKNCQAASGSAVYVGKTATFSGDLTVSGNTVSGANSGAIQTVDAGTLYFEGNVKVENNTCSADSDNDHDVLMHINGNTIINTTANGLGSGAKIGVYVSDPNSAYANHGQYTQPFGTYHNSTAGTSFLDAFFNNRNDILYGYQGEDAFIHWGYYVCKITDAAGNTLKRPNGRDAVYQQLSQAVGEFKQVTGGDPFYIKMLVEDYPLRQTSAISNFPATNPVANITLTTAGKDDANHPYRGTTGSVCTIYRTNSENPLFDTGTSGAIFQLKDITLDGRKSKTATEGDYKLITASTGEIIVNSGTTLQYAKGDSGAAITGATVTINGSYDDAKKAPSVKITNCTATGNGGAISAQNLTITNSTQGKYGTAFTNCTAAQGGAIYASGTAVNMAGATFTNCKATGEGGVLFHDNASATTTITNCAFAKSEATGGAGGAVSSKAGELTVNGSSFDTVKAAGNGGAINHTGTSSATISDTTFKACAATGFGGSVYTAAKEVSVEKDSFRNSTAADNGGALYCASDDGESTVAVSGTSFDNCAVTGGEGKGGAIYSATKALTLQDYTPEGSTTKTATTINACTATGSSGAVYMETTGSALNITGSTVISSCYADKGGAIYLPAGVTMNISDSPEFSQNGFTTRNGSVVNATEGACIYLAENGRINFQGSPKFSRNILPNLDRITNGGIYDNVRQDVYMAGYPSETEQDTNAASIYVVGKLTGDTIWVWPEEKPHRLPNEQFAKIAIPEGTALTADELDETLSRFRNSLADAVTGCNYGEYLAGVKVGNDYENVYWDKMYSVSFKKKDNKGVSVPDAGFTLYHYQDLSTVVLEEYFKPENGVVTFFSADGENDTDAQGKLLDRGMVEFAGIRIGAYYMKETTVPTSFKENDTIYLVLVGTPYLSNSDVSRSLWEGNGPLNVNEAGTLVARYTTDAGKYYGIFPLDENNKAILRANIASNNVGIENIRNDYQASFMKVDEAGNPLPGAAFTIYTQKTDSEGQPETFEDGYPKLKLWSRDGETYPAPVVSADGTAAYKDRENNTLPKGLVYFRELPLGTYYLLETAYPERNSAGRRTFYVESDRVFKLEITTDENDVSQATLSEWRPADETGSARYELLSKDDTERYYVVSNLEVVCKLTDANDNLLYVQGREVWQGNDSSTRLFPAIYHTLEAGFDAAQNGSFVYENGIPANLENGLKLKVLKDFALHEPVSYTSERDITFTTAETRAAKDRYIFSTTRTSDTSRAHITRAYNADTSADANAGALITLAEGADMTLQNILLDGQKSSRSGRAIHVTNGSLSIESDVQFQNFKVQAASGSAGESDVRGGAILMDDGTSLTINGGYNRTAIFSSNEVENNRTGDADTNGLASDGGAIALGANCTVKFENAQFIGNKAQAESGGKGSGGAVSFRKVSDATLKNLIFTSNSASWDGGAIHAASESALTLEGGRFSSNSALHNGGMIALLSEESKPSSLTITGGAAFTANKAENDGGAVWLDSYGILNIGSASTSQSAANNATMSSNFARNGGAIYAASNAEVAITRGTLQSNSAAEGSAVYAEDASRVTVTDGSITGNKASGANGGALNGAGQDVRFYLGGSPLIFDNVSAADSTQQRNVVLNVDSNNIINTTEDGLNDNALIGVYVTGSVSGELFVKHGLPEMPFGTFGDDGHLNPQVFRNDRALSLYGVKKENDSTIYWNEVICKLTEVGNNDSLLYQDITFTIKGKTATYKAPAVYAAVQGGFDAAQGTLYTRGGSKYSDFSANSLKLKMLKDVNLTQSVTYAGSRSVTFTTAETMSQPEDWFVFRTARSDDRDKALITRAFSGASLLVDQGTNLTLAGIILDGNKANDYTAANGGLVYVDSAAKLTVTTDATLRGSKATGKGGAVYVTPNATMVMDSGTITENEANQGGAVFLEPNATMIMDNGKAAGNENVSGGTINGNRSTGNGAGIYVDTKAVLKLSGSPYFGGNGLVNGTLVENYTDNNGKTVWTGNFSKSATDNLPVEAKNGGKTYQHARQDIYLADDSEKQPASILVTGNLIGSDGTIWVWAEKEYHYKQFMPFAKLDTNVTGGNLKMFRDARPDSETENSSSDYLYGTTEGEIKGYVYWSGLKGSRTVILRKVVGSDAQAESMAGMTFNVYRHGETDIYVAKHEMKNAAGEVIASSEERLSADHLISGANGVFWVGELPFGEYDIEEVGVGWFLLIVGDKDRNGHDLPDGYWISPRGDAKPQ